MLLYALDELFHVYCGIGVDDYDGLHVVAPEMSLALLCCTEPRGKPMASSQTSDIASTMVVHLDYLLNAVDSNAFQPEGCTVNTISGLTAILIMFLSDADLKGMEHIHIGLIVCCTDCQLYDQSGILPFIETINGDLEKA